MKMKFLSLRSQYLRALREAFYAADFLEVSTPVRIPAPAPEEYIEALRAEGQFLRTSPELAMKELLVEGAERIFQIGSAFRAGEHGRRHREEFTILEYYAIAWDYRKLADFTGRFLAEAALKTTGSTQINRHGEVLDFGKLEYITVNEAFQRYAGISAFEADARGDYFDELMVSKVEPQLGRGQLTCLIDYPAARASLSRLSAADVRVAERWELYGCGLELGNAFGELTDAAEQRKRFQQSTEFRTAHGMHPYPEASRFLAALERGLPDASGCALGVDRLLMLVCGADDIGDVLCE